MENINVAVNISRLFALYFKAEQLFQLQVNNKYIEFK